MAQKKKKKARMPDLCPCVVGVMHTDDNIQC